MYLRFTLTEKALSNLLLIGVLYVVHALKMREGINLFLGNMHFISETSRSLNCLDNSTCHDGSSFEVLCSPPFLEPGLGEQSQAKQAFLQFCRTGLPFTVWVTESSSLALGVRPIAGRVCTKDDACSHAALGKGISPERYCSWLHRRSRLIGTVPKMLSCSQKRMS